MSADNSLPTDHVFASWHPGPHPDDSRALRQQHADALAAKAAAAAGTPAHAAAVADAAAARARVFQSSPYSPRARGDALRAAGIARAHADANGVGVA